jgi:hypothetical protein
MKEDIDQRFRQAYEETSLFQLPYQNEIIESTTIFLHE